MKRDPITELRHTLWKQGNLAWKLRDYQEPVYANIWRVINNRKDTAAVELRKYVINISRKMGKSFLLVLINIEFALRYPGAQLRLGTTTATALRKIIKPIISQILADAPASCIPSFNGQDNVYTFPNGSQIWLFGLTMPDNARGPGADLYTVDEAAWCQNLFYAVQSVLGPMTMNTRGIGLLSSTPKPVPGTDFEQYAKECQALGQYSEYDIYHSNLSAAEIAQEMREAGGEESLTWQTEYLCKWAIDKAKVVIPESRKVEIWTAEQWDAYDPTMDEHAFWDRYEGMDFGTVDNTAVLFALWDFQRAQLIVYDERILVGEEVTSHNIAENIRQVEAPHTHLPAHWYRIGDNDAVLLQSLHLDERIVMAGIVKPSLESMINETRLFIGDGQLIVHERCKNLLGCLTNATWKEASDRVGGTRTRDLARSKLPDGKGKTLGHFDALMALVYLIRGTAVRRRSNPLPGTFKPKAVRDAMGPVTRDNYFIPHSLTGQAKKPPWAR